MSGDCPHREQLEETLRQYEQQKQLLTTTQTDYLHIIGELKDELDSLSCQVTSILDASPNLPSTINSIGTTTAKTVDESQICTPNSMTTQSATDLHIDLVASLGALEHQNDLLQKALEQATLNRADYCLELQEQNLNLRSQLQTLVSASMQKDKLIAQQSLALERQVVPKLTIDPEALNSARVLLQDANKRIENLENDLDRSRNVEQTLSRDVRTLNDELIDSKRKNGELLTNVERLRTLVKDGNEDYKNLLEKYEILGNRCEGQMKQIEELNKRIVVLQQCLNNNTMETKLLQHQLMSLKQKEATTTGELRALQERYMRLETEQLDAHKALRIMENAMKQQDLVLSGGIKKKEETNLQLQKELTETLDRLERYKREYREIQTICEKQTQIIETYKSWKEQQCQADASTKEAMSEYEEYLKLLTEQNASCLERSRALNEDNQCLQQEIERLRLQTLNIRPGVFTPISTRSPNNLLSNRLDQMRLTTQRVQRQKVELQNDALDSTNEALLEPSLLVPRSANAAVRERNVSPNPSSRTTITDSKAKDSRSPLSTNTSMKPP